MVKTNGVAIPMQLAIPKASTSASSSSTSKSKTCTSTSSSSTSKLKVSTSISNKSKSANHVKSKKSTSSERRQLYFVNPEKTGLVEKLTKHSSHNGGSKQKPGLISSKKRKSKHESDSDTDVNDDDDDDDDDLDFGDFEETYRKSKKTKSDSKRSATSKRSTSKSSNPYIVIDDSGSDLELRQTPNRKKSSEGRSSMEISRSNSNNSVDIDDLQDMYIGQLSTAANTPITPTDNQLQQSTLFSTSFNSSPESS